MSPRQLECFLEVYEQRSIKKAAKNLIISSQGVSKIIIDMERHLGVQLFIRGKKELEPTNEAEYVKNHAIKILEEFDKINNIKTFSNREKKITKIYCIEGFLQYVGFKFIEDFQKQYPEIVLSVIETTEKNIEEKLKIREIDMAITTKLLDAASFGSQYLYNNKICLVINKDNPLSKMKVIPELYLDNQPIAGKGETSSCYKINISKLFQKKINPKIMLETTNDSFIINMAERGVAIGITLDYIAFNYKSSNVVIRPLEGEGTSRDVFWIKNNYSILKEEEDIFQQFLFEWIKKHKSQLFHWELNIE